MVMPRINIRIFQFLIIDVLLLLLTACGGGGSNTSDGIGVATLTWTPPTTNVDGSTLNDLAGYKIYYGTSSRSYSNPIIVANPGIASYVVENLASGTYYFGVAAFDYSGNESAISNEASKVINQE